MTRINRDSPYLMTLIAAIRQRRERINRDCPYLLAAAPPPAIPNR